MKVLFIIPFVSRAYAKDWEKSCGLLSATLASLKNQSNPDFGAMILSNDRPDCDLSDPRFHFVQTELAIDDPARRGRRLVDKERKLHWALVEAPRLAPDYIMPLDADDLVSRRLVSWVDNNPSVDGFVLNHGYVYPEDDQYVYRSIRFHQRCGSCYVVRTDGLRLPEAHSDYSTSDYRRHWMVKTHNKAVGRIFSANNYSWHFVPFFAAIYRLSRQSECGNVRLGPVPIVDRIKMRVTRKKIDDRLMAEFGGLMPAKEAMPSDEDLVEKSG